MILAFLLFLLLAIPVSAQDVWNGSTNTAWYTSNPSATEYTITTAEQLAGLAELVNGGNDFEGKTVKLSANIILNETDDWESWDENNRPANEWVAIGNGDIDYEQGIAYGNYFNGIFDGNGYVVSGVYINNTKEHQGLFELLGYGIIKNLGVMDSYIKGGGRIGGVVGVNAGTVVNSYFIGTVVGDDLVGGLIGKNLHIVRNCYSAGIVIKNSNFTSGLVGNNYNFINNSYYVSQIGEQTEKGEGKTKEDMQSAEFVDNLNFIAGTLSANAWIYEEGNYPTLSNLPATTNITYFESGEGTEENPYIITTKEQLENISFMSNLGNYFWGAYFKLGNNIDLNGTADNPWIAILTFNGTFDGDGHVISNVYISNTDDTQGFIRVLGGTIKNLGVVNSYIESGFTVGGLVGLNQRGTISNSYSTGSVTGIYNIGGLVGSNLQGTVNNSYSTGTVTGSSYVGGLVGSNDQNSTVSNSYSTGTVTGDYYVGGLVGSNDFNSTVSNSYSTGAITGSDYSIGGLVGSSDYSNSTVSNSYYDSETSGQEDTGKGEGKSTVDMQSREFVDSLNFIAGILSMNAWNYEEGNYPTLSNTPVNANISSFFASGDGTEVNPYIIETKEHLENLSLIVNSGKNFSGEYFKLDNDIELNGSPYNTWTAIGNSANQFKGTFDGNGYIVSGVYIGNINNYKGLFGYLGEGGTIKNLGVIDSYIEGDNYVGGLVGYNEGIVINSYSTGTVTGDYYVGGLVGINSGTVNNSSSTNTVTGNGSVGGLVGGNGGSISNSYSVGAVTGSNSIGGLMGVNWGTVSNSYYDSETSGQTDTGKGDGKTTADMQSQEFAHLLNAGIAIPMNAWVYSPGKYPVLNTVPLASYFASGEGTEANPYIIKTQEHLEYLSFFVNAGKDFNGEHFKLDNDIALNGDEENSWTVIGINWEYYFSGTFDGNGHVISGVYINNAGYGSKGLFGNLSSEGTIKNLGVVDSYVKETEYGIHIGGLVGDNGGTVINSYFSGTVTTSGYLVGGLIGNNMGTVINSYFTGTVTATGSGNDVGGLIGLNGYGAVISNSYSTGTVTATGSSNNVGGLVGYNYKGGTISNSYSIGKVTGNGYFIGGLVGDNSGTVINSYYDSQTSERTDTGKGVGKTTAAMKQIATYTGWDFRGLWNISSTVNNGYPYLNIRIKTPIAADLNFAIPTDHIYTGAQQGIGTVTGAEGMGAITVLYNGIATIPTEIGTYAVTVNIAEGTEFTSIEGLSLGSYIISDATPIIPYRANPLIGGIGVQTISGGIVLTNVPINAKVEVYNLQGALVVTRLIASPQPMHIPISTKGMYIVRVSSQSLRVAVR